MIDVELSDLFFNYQHDNYNALDFKTATRRDVEAAILNDAVTFIAQYGEYLQIPVTYRELADDFLRRL